MATLTSPVRGATLSAQVSTQIQDLITSGAWAVGTRIPAEGDLVARLGVSRNTVREALRSLVHLGLLEARPGDGTYVRALSELAVPLIRRARRARLEEAVEIRGLLECQSARLAAKRRSDNDLIHFRTLVRELRRASTDGDRAAYANADAELHRAMVACTGNNLLSEIYEHLGGALKLSISPELWDQALAAEEVDRHVALVDALEAQDEAAAETAAGELMRVLTQSLLRPLDT